VAESFIFHEIKMQKQNTVHLTSQRELTGAYTDDMAYTLKTTKQERNTTKEERKEAVEEKIHSISSISRPEGPSPPPSR